MIELKIKIKNLIETFRNNEEVIKESSDCRYYKLLKDTIAALEEAIDVIRCYANYNYSEDDGIEEEARQFLDNNDLKY